MNRIISSFLIRLFIVIGFAFSGHLLVLHFLKLPLFNNKIILAYAINTGLAIFIFVLLFIFRQKFKNQLGFLFLAGSLVKFVLFFVFFNMPYRLDGIVSKAETFAFFVPYTFTLIVEIYCLSKWLNKLD
ncbi:MAG: hypothetical protein JKY02_10355 [Flavobacteriaceae bacterium]|nr:hypothetical protein [Flavobacteriaceae bacterium]